MTKLKKTLLVAASLTALAVGGAAAGTGSAAPLASKKAYSSALTWVARNGNPVRTLEFERSDTSRGDESRAREAHDRSQSARDDSVSRHGEKSHERADS